MPERHVQYQMVGDWKSSMYVQIDFIHYRYLSDRTQEGKNVASMTVSLKGGLGQHHRRLAAT